MGDACRFDFVYTRVTSVILNDVCFQHDIGLSLKLECEKLASEKTEMQRHYVMVSAGTNTLARFSLMPATENSFRDFDLDVFPFPVLRNVVRAEHRDAQAGGFEFSADMLICKQLTTFYIFALFNAFVFILSILQRSLLRFCDRDVI